MCTDLESCNTFCNFIVSQIPICEKLHQLIKNREMPKQVVKTHKLCNQNLCKTTMNLAVSVRCFRFYSSFCTILSVLNILKGVISILFSHEKLRDILLNQLLGINKPTTEFQELFEDAEDQTKFTPSLFKAKKLDKSSMKQLISIYQQIQEKKSAVSSPEWSELSKSPIRKKSSTGHSSPDKKLLQQRWDYYYLHALELFEAHFSLDKWKMLKQRVHPDMIAGQLLEHAVEHHFLLLEEFWTQITEICPDILTEEAAQALQEYNKPKNYQMPDFPAYFARFGAVSMIESYISSRKIAIIAGQPGCGKYASAMEYIHRHSTEYSYVFTLPMNDSCFKFIKIHKN